MTENQKKSKQENAGKQENNSCFAEECGMANLKIAKYKYTWTLNTSVFNKEVGDSVCSPGFSLGNNYSGVKWHIELHPKSICRKGFSTLYLCIKSCTTVKLQALYKFSILNARNEEDLKSYDWSIFTDTDINRTPHYFNTDRFINKSTGKMAIDKLIIICKVWFTLDTFEPNDNQDFERLLDDKSFSDITLLVNGKELSAHKNVLALKSPVFLSMFNEDLKDKVESTIEINGIEFGVIKEVLRYIYTKKVENLQEMGEELLAAADKYGLDGLKNICEKNLCKNLNTNNATNYLILSEVYKADKLKTEAINFIISNLKNYDLNSFGSLVESQPHLLAEILHTLGKKKDTEISNDTNSTESEKELFLQNFFS